VSESRSPAGRVTLADLEGDPHRVPGAAAVRGARRLGIPVLGTWLVTATNRGRGGPAQARTFTVDDPRLLHPRWIGRAALAGRCAATRITGARQPPFRHGPRCTRVSPRSPGPRRPPGVGDRALAWPKLAPAVAGRRAAVQRPRSSARPGRPATDPDLVRRDRGRVQAEGPPRARRSKPTPGADGVTTWRRAGRRRRWLAASLRE